jgi:hypothetical protein
VAFGPAPVTGLAGAPAELEALGPIVTQASAVLLMLVWVAPLMQVLAAPATQVSVAPLMQVSVAAQAQEFASAVSNLQLGTGKGQLG